MLKAFREVFHESATLPCRPTSPHYKVTLTADGKKVRNASYDRRFGFRLRNITFEDRDGCDFQCSIQEGDTIQAINFYLYSSRKFLHHVERGETINMTCSKVFDMGVPGVVNWTVPRWSDRVNTRLYAVQIASDKQRITNELTIEEITVEEAGWYTCVFKALSEKIKKHYYLAVHNDPEINHVYLLPDSRVTNYERKCGDHVMFVVDIDAYPQPKLRWLNKFAKQDNGHTTQISKS